MNLKITVLITTILISFNKNFEFKKIIIKYSKRKFYKMIKRIISTKFFRKIIQDSNRNLINFNLI